MRDRTRRLSSFLRRLGATCAAVGALLGGSACTPPPEPSPPPGWNVIVLMADTLRADHLGAYGYARDTSPWLDRLARDEAVLFEEASAQASCTYPSVNSLLTSRHPGAFIGEERSMAIPDAIPTLASTLAAAGYDTMAFSASPIVRATPSNRNPDAGFGAGFRMFDESCLWRSARCMVKRSVKQLDSLREPFLLYLHFMDPHAPYGPPRDSLDFAARPEEDMPERDFIRAGDVVPIEKALYSGGEPPGVTDEELGYLVDLYDDGIRFMDAHWEELEQELRTRGLWERSVVVVVSDHGEELMETGEHIGHCRTLSRRLLHLPLIVRVPGVEGGRRIERVVSNLDVVPTLLDLLRIDPGEAALEGESLASIIDPSHVSEAWADVEEREERPEVAFAWQAWLASVRDARYKLIVDLRNGSARLYDLVEDPGETRDLSDERPEVVRRLGRELRRHWGEGLRSRQETLRHGQEVMERLRGLGYLQ